jgi:hypothetical protein
MKRSVVVLSVVLSAGLLFGCGSNMNSASPTSPTPTPSTSPAPLGLTVSGVVTDAGSSRPLADVTVQWKGLPENWGDRGAGVRTDSNGAYQLVIPTGLPADNRIEVRASKCGYVDTILTVGAAGDIKVNVVLVVLGTGDGAGCWDY